MLKFTTLFSMITSYFREQGLKPILCGTTGKEVERGGDGDGGDREAVGDLSLQIGTTETFPNRM